MKNKYLFSTQNAIPKDRVAVLQQAADGFLLRWFKETTASLNTPPVTQLRALQFAASDLVVDISGVVYGAAALSAELDPSRLFVETHQQWISPSAMQDGMYGYAELYDFVALVAPVSPSLDPQYTYNHFLQSINAKASVRRIGRVRGEYAHITFVADALSSPISEWTLVRYEVPGILFVDQTPGSWQAPEENFSLLALLPAVSVSTPAEVPANEYVDVQVSLTRGGQPLSTYDGELVAEAVVGYCPKQRIQITGGVGQLRIGALGLAAGDSVRVKLGTRNVAGLTDVAIPVV